MFGVVTTTPLFCAKNYKLHTLHSAQGMNSSILDGCQLFSVIFSTIPKWIAHHQVQPNYIKLKTSIPRPKKAIKRLFSENYFTGEAPKSRHGCLCFVSPTVELFYLNLSTALLCLVVCGQMPFPK